jgi:hypothetical protein
MHALTRPRRDLLAELAVQFVAHILSRDFVQKNSELSGIRPIPNKELVTAGVCFAFA